MRSDWKRNEIGRAMPLGPFWDRHWLIFLSSKATAFIYLGDLKARGLVIVASCSTPNLTIRTNESCISLQLSDQSFFELYFDKFPWVEANLHWALPKSSMTQCSPTFLGFQFSNEENERILLFVLPCCLLESHLLVFLALFPVVYRMRVAIWCYGLASPFSKEICRKQLRMVFYHRASVHLLDCYSPS